MCSNVAAITEPRARPQTPRGAELLLVLAGGEPKIPRILEAAL